MFYSLNISISILTSSKKKIDIKENINNKNLYIEKEKYRLPVNNM